MSGTPSEAEIQTQWKYSLVLLEKIRAIADTNIVGAAKALDNLMQSLEGEYTPTSLSAAASRFRSNLSSAVDSQRAREFLDPLLFEYAKFLGYPSSNTEEIAQYLARNFAENSKSVVSRGLTIASSGSLVGGSTGNGSLIRLSKDRWNKTLEGITPEVKTFTCIQDAASGARSHAEVFVCEGKTPSIDALNWANSGSGQNRFTVRALHAGSGEGGSLLRNSSFSVYNSASTPKFDGWSEVSGGSQISQNTASFYRSFPGATTDASLRINGGGGLVNIRQPLSSMRIGKLDTETPYLLSVAVNKTVGTAVGGTFTIRIGGVSVDTTITALSAGWNRINVPLTDNCWFESFNDGDIDVEIEWSSSTSGYLLVDDIVFSAWTEIDGSYFAIIGGTTPFLEQDKFTVTDTGGAPGTGIVNYWLWKAGYRTLPSSGSPTFTDPTIP